ncbi:MAG TPA: hydrogenase formation protein HypD [Candidatus Binataceae bacterium]|nr:hydrogenase formation protein HypD [Candidatus Binataceae bacterium]
MKFVDEFRDADFAHALLGRIRAIVTKPWTIMEVCGGQTHTIVRYGIDELLPPTITLVHGPGCPVCVTPIEMIDLALEVAKRPEVILCSFGDMLRVPGSSGDLFDARATGADVRIVYSPLDALALARREPSREIVFFAVGFETTAPTTAMAVHQASRLGIGNFSVISAHVRVPPAIEAILSTPANRIQGFLAAGHVCTIMGIEEYLPLVERFKVPIVVTGFEPVDLLQGIEMCVAELEAGRAEVENQYERSVRMNGNPTARALIKEVFSVVDQRWRGLDTLPRSALRLSDRYAAYDATRRFGLVPRCAAEPAECRAGEVLRGVLKPPQCEAFRKSCTPERPLGAPMVSSEGACAAYFRAGREAARELK